MGKKDVEYSIRVIYKKAKLDKNKILALESSNTGYTVGIYSANKCDVLVDGLPHYCDAEDFFDEYVESLKVPRCDISDYGVMFDRSILLKRYDFSDSKLIGITILKGVYNIIIVCNNSKDVLLKDIPSLEEADVKFKEYVEILGGSLDVKK